MYQLHPTAVHCYVVRWNLRLSVTYIIIGIPIWYNFWVQGESHYWRNCTNWWLTAKNWPFLIFKVHFFSNPVHLSMYHSFSMIKFRANKIDFLCWYLYFYLTLILSLDQYEMLKIYSIVVQTFHIDPLTKSMSILKKRYYKPLIWE